MLGAVAIAGAVGLGACSSSHASPGGPYANPQAVASKISANLHRAWYCGDQCPLRTRVTCVSSGSHQDVCDWQVFLGNGGGPYRTGSVTAYVSADGDSFVTSPS